MVGVDFHAVEFRRRILETPRKRLRPLEFDEGTQALPGFLVQATHIEQAHLDICLVGEHIVVVGSTRAHSQARFHVPLFGYQDVLQDRLIKAVERLIRRVERHSTRIDPFLPIG